MKMLTWPIVLYAILSLTVVRMVPVAVALVGTRLGWATVSLVAWFGPRGLASVVFALLALEELGSPTAGHAVAVITITVLLSVVLHGVTAEPLAAWYARLLARHAADQAGAQVPEMPERRLIRHKLIPHRNPPGRETE
jgi:NhaP-type Na+/H+ or K+/H+ antiporter